MKTQRNLWPLGIILTFVVFVSGMAWVVVIASTHQDSLVSNSYYEQELKFQSQIDAAARAAKSGATIFRDAGAGNIVITLNVAELKKDFFGKVEFYRPSAPELDHEIPLAPKADGTQTINISRLANGPWSVRVKWNTGGQAYFLEQKIII
jgi:hypothetical protein